MKYLPMTASRANDTLQWIKIPTYTTSYKIVKYGIILLLKYEQIAHEDVNDKLCFANQIYHKLYLQSMSPLRARRTFSIKPSAIDSESIKPLSVLHSGLSI